MGAEAADGSIRFSSRPVRNTVGVFGVAVGGGRMQPLSPACQSTWWMDQFHINLMLNSFNWIIYTVQRHMGSQHFNPRWALDLCSQAIGLWPAVDKLMLCWLSPACQLTAVRPRSCSAFLQACTQEVVCFFKGATWYLILHVILCVLCELIVNWGIQK